jgi:hypothetical protein
MRLPAIRWKGARPVAERGDRLHIPAERKETRMRSSLTTPLIGTLFALAAVIPLSAQDPAPERPTVTLRGFVSATAFLQDHAFGFGNGQNALWASYAHSDADPWFLGGDVRNTRIGMGIAGPTIYGGWTTGGNIEVDFFGGFPGTGMTADEQPLLRLRLAHVDLARGGTTIRIGQAWAPIFGNVPVSATHLGFPIGLGSGGVIGWRFPGLFVYQRLTAREAPLQAQLQLAAFRGSWDGPGPNVEQMSAGEASLIPQLEARFDLGGRTQAGLGWNAYVVGHFDRKDLSGVGREAAADDILEGRAIAAGARLTGGPVTLHGNAYRGRAVGQLLGHISQVGDIEGWGGWTQLGFAFTPQLSAWLHTGMDDPDDASIDRAIVGAARLRNRQLAGMLRYGEGPYAAGVQWLRADTRWRAPLAEGGAVVDRSGNQLSVSVLFSF